MRYKPAYINAITILLATIVIASGCSRDDGSTGYYHRYVENAFVEENTFLKKEYVKAFLPGLDESKDLLPSPIWEGHQDEIDCYWKTWEIAFSNLRQPQRKSGFVSNYVTTGFNEHIFMWGHVFMQMYWKYAAQVFPYQESLENFYTNQHPDGYISRQISEVNGLERFTRFDLSSTGPNILPWAEWNYFQISGDLSRLKAVFPVLVANKQWVMKYRTWQDGTYYANGWSSGMDNQPRLPEGCSKEFEHGHMSWIDITLEQIFMDDILLKMADILGRRQDIPDIEAEREYLANFVNEKMWNEDIDFYVDRYRDGSISDVKSIGGYWALLADIIPGENLEAFCDHLENVDEFARPHRIPSLSADTPGYQDFGDYWRGSIWCITNYMVLQGLMINGEDSLAHEIALNHIDKIVERYLETETIWENYAPEEGFLPTNCRPDFVGFSGVSPISILLENVIGIRADVPNNRIVWDVRLLDKHGIHQYPFGIKGLLDLSCEERSNTNEEPQVSVTSNVPLIVIVVWEGGTKTITVEEKKNAELYIQIEQEGSEQVPAAWIRVQSEENSNIGGWYSEKTFPGFPAFSPIKLDVPEGKLKITAWNSVCNPVTKEIIVEEDQKAGIKLQLEPRVDLHSLGYFSFDSHNHLNGYEEKNRPPYIYSYCASLGIDHLDLCQGWLFGLRMPVSYDSLVNYFSEYSNERLSLRFGSETPKLRYGHTWTVNHPGLEEPFNDYLKWHDGDYFRAIGKKNEEDPLDLRGSHAPKWHPPFVDRIRYKSQNGFTVAAHPTRWWHTSEDEIHPATNIAADLAFDLLTAQSYNGIVVMGDHQDNIYYQNLWFNLLNLGYRLVPVAESDGNIYDGSLGRNALTYAWTGEQSFNFKSMLHHLREGHTMLSGKALMILNVDQTLPPGTVLYADGEKHTIDVKVYSETDADEYISYLVLYRNGKVKEKIDLRKKKKRMVQHTFKINETETAWYLVKSYGKEYPLTEEQFDVMAYAESNLFHPNVDYGKNTGISMTAPVYFNGSDWEDPRPMISHIYAKVVDKNGVPLRNTEVEVWNIDERLEVLTTDDQGCFDIQAPASVDVRCSVGGRDVQQWLFYEYPPLLDLIENIYTVAWQSDYPGIGGGQMPWSAFHYDELKETLKEIHWTIRL